MTNIWKKVLLLRQPIQMLKMLVSPFHLLDTDEEADDIELYNFYFLTLVKRNYEI